MGTPVCVIRCSLSKKLQLSSADRRWPIGYRRAASYTASFTKIRIHGPNAPTRTTRYQLPVLFERAVNCRTSKFNANSTFVVIVINFVVRSRELRDSPHDVCVPRGVFWFAFLDRRAWQVRRRCLSRRRLLLPQPLLFLRRRRRCVCFCLQLSIEFLLKDLVRQVRDRPKATA